MNTRYSIFLLAIAMTCPGADRAAPPLNHPGSWVETLRSRIPFYGHRNWIVVADSAYPAQSREGIETLVADADQLQVLKEVLFDLSGSKHVTPIVYTDQELKFIDEKDAPGISAYREQLASLLQNRPVHVLLHEQIISKLDQVSQTFRVLIIKTKLTLPYTSVFLQLDCAYWNEDAERRLRETMIHSLSK